MQNSWMSKIISGLVASAMLLGQAAPAFAFDDDDDSRRWSRSDDRDGRWHRSHDRRDWRDERRDDWRDDRRDHRRDHWRDERRHDVWRSERHRYEHWQDKRHLVPRDWRYAHGPAVVYRGKPVRYVHYPRQNVIYYYDRPDVVYVHGAPRRYYYDTHRRGYYYKDDRGNSVLLGAALGAIGLAAVLAASR